MIDVSYKTNDTDLIIYKNLTHSSYVSLKTEGMEIFDLTNYTAKIIVKKYEDSDDIVLEKDLNIVDNKIHIFLNSEDTNIEEDEYMYGILITNSTETPDVIYRPIVGPFIVQKTFGSV